MHNQVIAVLSVALAALAVCTSGAQADELVDPTYSYSRSYADNNSGSFSQDIDSSTSPYQSHTTSTTDGDVSSSSETISTSTKIDISGSWETGTGSEDFAQTGHAFVEFRADGAVEFIIDGAYEFEGGTGEGFYRVYLFDLDANSFVFDNQQLSTDVDGESFDVGESGGATSNTLIGGLTGTLTDGHDYRFYMLGSIYNNDNSDALTGSGWATLTVTNPVPEPGTVALLGLGFVGLAAARRRRSRLRR